MKLADAIAEGPGKFKVALRPERYGLQGVEMLELEIAWLGTLDKAELKETPRHIMRKLCVKDNGATLEQLRRCALFVEAA